MKLVGFVIAAISSLTIGLAITMDAPVWVRIFIAYCAFIVWVLNVQYASNNKQTINNLRDTDAE